MVFILVDNTMLSHFIKFEYLPLFVCLFGVCDAILEDKSENNETPYLGISKWGKQKGENDTLKMPSQIPK